MEIYVAGPQVCGIYHQHGVAGAFVASAPLPAPGLPHGAGRMASIYQFRSCHIARLIEQHIHSSEESHGMRQFGVRLECSLRPSTGMKVEEPPVSHGTKQMKVQASLLFAEGPATSRNACSTRSLFLPAHAAAQAIPE